MLKLHSITISDSVFHRLSSHERYLLNGWVQKQFGLGAYVTTGRGWRKYRRGCPVGEVRQ